MLPDIVSNDVSCFRCEALVFHHLSLPFLPGSLILLVHRGADGAEFATRDTTDGKHST